MSPSHQERVFKQSYAFELLKIARADWNTAVYLKKGVEEAVMLGEKAVAWAEDIIQNTL